MFRRRRVPASSAGRGRPKSWWGLSERRTVANYTDKLANQASGALGPGEFFIAAAKYLPRGASAKRAAGGVFGAVGTVIAGSGAGRGQIVGGAPLPSNLAMGLTNQRLLIFALGEGLERVTGQTHSIPLSHVLSVRCDTGRKLGFRVTYVTISLADGSEVSLEAVSPHSKDGEAFARSLETSRSAAASSSKW
jgi:hypothetical protein